MGITVKGDRDGTSVLAGFSRDESAGVVVLLAVGWS
jgi:hypothetical protein